MNVLGPAGTSARSCPAQPSEMRSSGAQGVGRQAPPPYCFLMDHSSAQLLSNGRAVFSGSGCVQESPDRHSRRGKRGGFSSAFRDLLARLLRRQRRFFRRFRIFPHFVERFSAPSAYHKYESVPQPGKADMCASTQDKLKSPKGADHSGPPRNDRTALYRVRGDSRWLGDGLGLAA